MPFSKLQDRPEPEDSEAVDKHAVMRRFSVSLVFQHQVGGRLMTALRVVHVDARSKDEAFGSGMAIVREDDELKDYSLLLYVVIEFIAA
jgi:hypothetical protein